MFRHRVRATPSKPAFQHPSGNAWAWLNWREAADRVRDICCGLLDLGIQPQQRCAIQSSTRLDWILADMGILSAGAATTTVYPSMTGDDTAYILNDSGSQMAFVEDEVQVAKLTSKRSSLDALLKVVVFDGSSGHDGWVITLPDLEELGRRYAQDHPEAFDASIDAIAPDHLATLMYTSGTTGRPKGVELVHDSWVYEGESIAGLDLVTPDDHQYLWLPLSHAFGKVLQAAQICVGFPTTVDGRIDKLVDNLAVVRPTFMAAAPRVFEKVYAKAVTTAAEGGRLRYTLFRRAVEVGKRVSRLRRQGRSVPILLRVEYAVLDRLVFTRLRQRFGGRMRFMISGSAPLSMEMAEFFHAAGLLILEGYGLTETSAASFVNHLGGYRFGTVGLPIGPTEVKIAEEDGEILLRGRSIMRGYHNLPEATAEVLDEDGWLHTGDIGEVDHDGFLRITDRKKDLIKTSGGKYVAPQITEGKVKALCPYISQVLVHGDRRNYCTAIVTLDEPCLTQWAQDNDIEGSYEELTQNQQMKILVQHAFDELNAQLAAYESIKKFAILPRDLTEEAGELTPNQKVKRRVVEQHYTEILDGFYKDALPR
jgi:long-chain acyl-CoA synthetase